jgi:hypothetical protein
VRRLEVRPLLLSFNWLLALNEFQWVFLVSWEFIQCLVVAVFGRIRWLESLVVKGLMGLNMLFLTNLLLLFRQRNI